MKKKPVENYYTIRLNPNTTQGGFFRIYQARNGSIQLCMGNGHITLTMQNISDLHLDSTLYELEEFDTVDFDKFYNTERHNEPQLNGAIANQAQ